MRRVHRETRPPTGATPAGSTPSDSETDTMTVEATVDLEGALDDLGTSPAVGAPTDEPGDPADLGDAGRRAIQAERAARAEAERQLADVQRQLTSSAARITELETGSGTINQQVEDLRVENLRYRTAVEKGLAPELVGRLVGSTAEELSADADSLLALMGARQAAPAPRPDPSQGSRTPPAQSAEAQFKAALGPLLNT